MKLKPFIITVLFTGIVSSLITLKFSKNTQKIDYLGINCDGLISADKAGYYELSLKEEPAPVELTKFLINQVYLQGHQSQFVQPTCIEQKMCFVDDEVSTKTVDLNEDDVKEFIVMPWKICGCSMRGASGNGDIFVVKEENNGFKILGNLEGNGYVISKRKTNDYYDILVNFHSTYATGSESLYKFQITSSVGGSFPQYEQAFTKWYDLDRGENDKLLNFICHINILPFPGTRTTQIHTENYDRNRLCSLLPLSQRFHYGFRG